MHDLRQARKSCRSSKFWNGGYFADIIGRAKVLKINFLKRIYFVFGGKAKLAAALIGCQFL